MSTPNYGLTQPSHHRLTQLLSRRVKWMPNHIQIHDSNYLSFSFSLFWPRPIWYITNLSFVDLTLFSFIRLLKLSISHSNTTSLSLSLSLQVTSAPTLPCNPNFSFLNQIFMCNLLLCVINLGLVVVFWDYVFKVTTN